MLSAQTRAGMRVSLGYPYKKETLQYLREKEEFFCPMCGEKVILKLGERKIFHFAHKSKKACSGEYENETQYHMEGKLKLFHWLKRQKVEAVLEYYDKEIRQRPDIVFYANGQKYALEYQCSPLSEEIFRKRTESYLQNNYIPLWILGEDRLQLKQGSAVSLSNFHYLFLRETTDHQIYLPFFTPEDDRFDLFSSIYPYTAKYAHIQKLEISSQQANLSSIIQPKINDYVNGFEWRRRMDHYQWNWSLHSGKEQMPFFQELYMHQLNPFLLPVEIGLPVPHGLLFQTVPFVWQTYVYLDLLFEKPAGKIISPEEINNCFRRRARKGNIHVRNLPQIQKSNPLLAIYEYLHILAKFGAVDSAGNGYFKIVKPLSIPKTNREREKLRDYFSKSGWVKQING